MSWVAVGLAAAGVVMGKMKSDDEASRADKARQLRAKEQGLSWASGQKNFTEVPAVSSEMGNMFQGGLTGYATGSNINAANAKMAAPVAAPPSAPAAGGQFGLGDSPQSFKFDPSLGQAPTAPPQTFASNGQGMYAGEDDMMGSGSTWAHKMRFKKPGVF